VTSPYQDNRADIPASPCDIHASPCDIHASSDTPEKSLYNQGKDSVQAEWLERAERRVPPEAMLGLKDNLLVDDLRETQIVKEMESFCGETMSGLKC